jgi:hypothetical protein
MVRWEDLARPKDFGGLGLTDIRLMNKWLLFKWIFKIERGDTDLCSTLLRKKYLKEKVFSVGMLEEHHNFGKGYMSLRILVRGGYNVWLAKETKPGSDMKYGWENAH